MRHIEVVTFYEDQKIVFQLSIYLILRIDFFEPKRTLYSNPSTSIFNNASG